MEARSVRTAPERKPSFKRAAIAIGCVLTIALGVGLALQPGKSDEKVTVRTASRSNAAHARQAPARASNDATSSNATAVASAPAGPVNEPTRATVATPTASATEPEHVLTGPVSYADGESAYLAGDYDEAVAILTRYVEQKPTNAWGSYMLGLALWKTDRLDDSEQAFRQALSLDPDHEKSLVNLTRVLLDANRPSDALPVAQHAVAVAPESGTAYRVLGRVWHTLGSPEEALVAYGRATEIDSTDAWAWNNAGLLLIERERFDEAVEQLAHACEHGTDARFFNNYGVALERTERYGDAADAYARAVGLDEGSEKAAASLARVQPFLVAEDPSPVLATENEPTSHGELDLVSTAGVRELGEEGSSGE